MSESTTWSAPDVRIELELLERLPDSAPTPGDVRLRVTLRPEGGETASYDGVWLARPELEAFVVELQEWLAIAEGSPRVEALSPGEFSLELVTGRAGSAGVLRSGLGRTGTSGVDTTPTSVQVNAALSGNEVAGLQAFFTALLERPS